MAEGAHVAIIGGGAIGASIAYHLAKAGCPDVILLEQGTVGAATTSKAAGGIRAQFATETEIWFALRSIEFFGRFREEMGVDCGYRQVGYLYLLTSPELVEEHRRRIALQNRFGVPSRLISPEEVRELVPEVRVDDVLAAAWCPTDGYASPHEVVQAYVAQARRRGVKILEGVRVTGLEVTDGRIRAVLTPEDRFEAHHVVNAAGPWAGEVGAMAGVEIPIMPRRRHIFVTDSFPWIRHPTPLVADLGSGFYFRSDQDRILMSPGDEGVVPDFEAAVDWSILPELVEKAVRRVPIFERAAIKTGWAGLRPLTPDGRAVVGRAPGFENFWLAVGFCGHGFQHSPAAGMVMADLILKGAAPVDLSVLSPERFRFRPAESREPAPD